MGHKWNSPVGASRYDVKPTTDIWNHPLTIGAAMTGVMFGLLGLVRYLR
jgi:hypothetical protein